MKKSILLLLFVLFNVTLYAQEVKVSKRATGFQAVSDKALKVTDYFAVPFGFSPSFPSFVPDTVKTGSLFYVEGNGLQVFNGTTWVNVSSIDTTTYTFTNGLQKTSGTNVQLGGYYSGAVTLTGSTNSDYISLMGNSTTGFMLSNFTSDAVYFVIDGVGSHVGNSRLEVDYNEITLNNARSGLWDNTLTVGSLGISIEGLPARYVADYSSVIRLHPNDLTSTKAVILIADSIKATISGASGTVTSIATGFGLTGGTITTTGTLKVDTSAIQTIDDFFPKGDTRYYKSSNPSGFITSSSLPTFSNGLTLSSGVAKLGGTISATTTITQGVNIMQFTGTGSVNSTSFSIQPDFNISDDAQIIISATNTTNHAGATIGLKNTGATFGYVNSSSQNQNINFAGGFELVTDAIKTTGLVNVADYSTNIRLQPNALTTSKTVKLIADSVKATISSSLTAGRGILIPSTAIILDTTQNYNWLKAQTITKNSLSTTSTDGFILQNTTASTSSVTVQYSPRQRFIAHAWNTTITAADNQIDFINELRPTSSLTPGGSLVWSKRVSTSGSGSFIDILSLRDDGLLTVAGSVVSAGSFTTTVGTVNGVGVTATSYFLGPGIGVNPNNTEFFIGQARTFSVAGTAIGFNMGTASNSSGIYKYIDMSQTLNQNSTAGYTILGGIITETGIGSGAKNIQDWVVGSTHVFTVDHLGGIVSGATIQPHVYTVSGLPAAGSAGRTAYVTDATAPTYLGTLIGGGTTGTPVVDNGTAWVSY